MLEHVAANQTRFVAPGLSPDTRGVALGRFLTVLLPSIDRVVGLFRGLSEKLSLDEILPSLRIVQVRTPLQSRELLVQLPVGSSYAADSIAAVAHLVGGLCFTGSAKHFVRYRDSRSPLGYDVDTLHGGGGDFVLYASDFVQVYAEEREIEFARLAQTLSLQHERGDSLLAGDVALLRVARGLWRTVLGYLHRSGVRCAAAAAELPRPAGGEAERFFLLRCDDLPRRMVELFTKTPGVEVLRLKTPTVAVQLGYRHPFELSSCSSIFDGTRFYLYSGERDRVELLEQLPHFVAAATLVQLGPLSEAREAQVGVAATAEQVRVPLKLVPVSGAQPHLVASRIPLAEADRLKRLTYLLPPPVLASYGICVTPEHIYLYSEAGIDFLPLGELFWALAPGVMIPQGFNLLPRVAPEVLREHLHTRSAGRAELEVARGEQLFFFTADQPAPLRIPRGAFSPLGRYCLAEVDIQGPVTTPLPAPPVDLAIELVNDEIGLFPLWSFEAGLPARTEQGDE